MPNTKTTIGKNTAELASSPSAAGSQPALGALREAERRTDERLRRREGQYDEDDALDVEADRALAEASARMDGERSELQQDISERAYEIYLARGEEDGDELSDWLEAERQVRSRARS